jgi:hypothetical protein
MQKSIQYFETPGKGNTDDTLKAARARVEELGIKQLVLATSHGYTAKRAKVIFEGLDIRIIPVAICAGYAEEGWTMSMAERESLEKLGLQVLVTTHALSGDASEGMGVAAANTVVRDTLYLFGQGTKVAVEVTLMAADAGLLDMSAEVMAIGGTEEGADTALVIKPAYSRKIKSLRVREIVTKPR